MSVDREQVRRDAERLLSGTPESIKNSGSQTAARHCLALLAEFEQAERERDEAAWPRLDHWRERAQAAEARLAKVPALVEFITDGRWTYEAALKHMEGAR